MVITRRAVVGGLAAAAVLPASAAEAAQPVRLSGPVYARAPIPWPVVRPWMWSRWHFHEHSPGKAFIRHCSTGLTFAAVEFALFFSVESLPVAVQELRFVSDRLRSAIDPERIFTIGHAARYTAANSWLVEACRRGRPGGAVYFDWSVDDPDGEYFGGAATASLKDAPPLLPGLNLSSCAGARSFST
jgi:hypothetical protein